MQWIIEARGVTKRFPVASRWKDLLGKRKFGPRVVDHINLLVREGELFGLVGPNGAGKTTVIKMLTTLIVPSSGTIRIAGYDIREEINVKKAIGLATSDERSFYWRLSGRQNLQFFASLHNMSWLSAKRRIDEVLSQVGLERVSDDRFHTYSTGMRQRLAIARALLTEPRVIFMDEPTKGLDPMAASQFHKLIRDHLVNDLGITVFLTSHQLSEVEKLCDRVAIMNAGKIRGCGTMVELRELLEPVEKYRVEVQGLSRAAASKIAEQDSRLQLVTLGEDRICFESDSDHSYDRLAALIIAVHANEGRLRSVTCSGTSLDAIYEYVINKSEYGQLCQESDTHPVLPVCHNSGAPLLTQDPSTHMGQYSIPATAQTGLLEWMKGKARVLHALTRRDMLSETSYRLSFLMQMVEIFLTVTVLFFLSRMIGQGTMNRYLEPYGGDYFAFAIIGVAFYSYFNVGFSKFAAQLSEAQKTGTLEAMLSTPAGLSTIVLGSSLWEFAITTVKVIVLLLAGALMMGSGMRMTNFPLVLLILLLTIASASSFGIVAACFIIVVKKGDPISWLFKSASWLLGGVLFPITVFPAWMQKLSLLLPTTHALRAMRLTILQGRPISYILPEIGALCIFCFLLLPVSLRGLRYAVRRAKQEGTLTHY